MMGSSGVSRILDVLRLLASAQDEGLRAVEVAKELGLPYTTAHRLLRSLKKEGAVERTEDGKRYCIGPTISMLGLARTGHFSLRAVALGSMMRIQATTSETCFLTVASDLDSVCIHRETGSNPRKVLSIDVGSRRPLGVVIGSVAYLSTLPEEQVLDIVEKNSRRYGRHRLTAEDVLRRVEEARTLGFAYADRGLRPGTRSLGAAILGRSGDPVAALSVVAVDDRLPDWRRDEIAQTLMQEARMLSKHIK